MSGLVSQELIDNLVRIGMLKNRYPFRERSMFNELALCSNEVVERDDVIEGGREIYFADQSLSTAVWLREEIQARRMAGIGQIDFGIG